MPLSTQIKLSPWCTAVFVHQRRLSILLHGQGERNKLSDVAIYCTLSSPKAQYVVICSKLLRQSRDHKEKMQHNKTRLGYETMEAILPPEAVSMLTQKLSADHQDKVATVSLEDTKVGSLLGSGSFSDVFDVWIAPPVRKEETLRRDHSPRREPVKCNHPRKSSHAKHALKAIRSDLYDDEDSIHWALQAALFEGALLSKLGPHENIVNLVAVSENFWNNPLEGFLILEKITETLEFRMLRWSQASCTSKRGSPFSFLFRPRSRDTLYEQRDRIRCSAVGIARALAYLHRHGVIHR